MRAALVSEFRKVSSTRLWWLLTLIMVAYLAVAAVFTAFVPFMNDSGMGFDTGSEMSIVDGMRVVTYTLAVSQGAVYALLLGAMCVTNEYRHSTWTPTYLVEPRRWRVVAAKAIIGIGTGIFLGIVGVAASAGPGAIVYAAKDQAIAVTGVGTWELFGRVIIAMALWGLLGVGAGTLMRNQVAAIIVIVAFVWLVEPLLRMFARQNELTETISHYLPGAASDSILGVSFLGSDPSQGDLLTHLQGGLVLAAWGVGLTLLGYYVSSRRDVS
jgi:ABC-type transport system involved in multi-copper enzyme maturation permease subunit